MNKRLLAAIVIIVVALGAGVGLSLSGMLNPAAKPLDTLVVGDVADLGGPITPLWTNGMDEVVTNQMFEGLLGFKPGTLDMEPVLSLFGIETSYTHR